MKKQVMLACLASVLTGSLAATVLAAGASPFGQLGEYDKVKVIVDRTPVEDKGLLIDGNLYIPVNALREENKLAYVYDPETYQAYLFFGGTAANQGTNPSATDQSPSPSEREVALGFMSGIPYEADDYHSGMMRQDVINIATLAKALLDTSGDWENAVYSKLNFNRNPNLSMLRQKLAYRTVPFQVLEDRMEALAEELGDQISGRYERKMEDVIDELEEAVEKKEKALESLEDWLQSSDEDDLEDYRDYDEEAKESISDAIEKLTGEDLEDPTDHHSNNIKEKVEEWSRKQQKLD
ncbi:hypothetical protein LOK74_18850 [Brevibacillus humidisoli]|uniref:hypothetical protein n=1 Tax=Brevibacillus humidisoli TaxID=2895522 RepID=UPI001E521357|nr:hypothetical protein [Brevibacillus humidisoli]UFJ40072.1 hypothetical protein LOK74_18850 [Brevibacillus humidisoli]